MRAGLWFAKAEHTEHLPTWEKAFRSLPPASTPEQQHGVHLAKTRSWRVLRSCSLELSSLQSHSVKPRAGLSPCPSLYNCFSECFHSTQPSRWAESPPARGMSCFFEYIALISCRVVAAANSMHTPPSPPPHAPCRILTNMQSPMSHQPASWRCHLAWGG